MNGLWLTQNLTMDIDLWIATLDVGIYQLKRAFFIYSDCVHSIDPAAAYFDSEFFM